MIVVMRPSATQQEVDGVKRSIEEHGLEAFLSVGEERTVIGVVGSLLGSGFGALLAWLFEVGTADASGVPRFAVQLSLSLFVWASALATFVGLLSAVLPARRASRLDPVAAIRNG